MGIFKRKNNTVAGVKLVQQQTATTLRLTAIFFRVISYEHAYVPMLRQLENRQSSISGTITMS